LFGALLHESHTTSVSAAAFGNRAADVRRQHVQQNETRAEPRQTTATKACMPNFVSLEAEVDMAKAYM
jgi:hypothetical protein